MAGRRSRAGRGESMRAWVARSHLPQPAFPALVPHARYRRNARPFRGRVLTRRWSSPVSSIAHRTAFMRVVKADSETIRPSQTAAITAPWKPELGAQLAMLRWKYFVQSEDDAFVALIDAFTKTTGVKVSITRESVDDVQPKASVAANTGAGPNLIWVLYSLPNFFQQTAVAIRQW